MDYLVNLVEIHPKKQHKHQGNQHSSDKGMKLPFTVISLYLLKSNIY